MELRIQGHPEYGRLILADVQTISWFEETNDEYGPEIDKYKLTFADAPVYQRLVSPVDFVPFEFHFYRRYLYA
jgi:hypothetical protein